MNKKKNKRVVSFIAIFTLVFNLMSSFFVSQIHADGTTSLTINKLVDKTTVLTGEEFTYTLQYSNPSTTTDAANVVLTDVLPANVVYVSNSPSPDIESVDAPAVGTNGNVVFHFKTPLKAGKSGIVKITVKFPAGISQAGAANAAINSATIVADNASLTTSNLVTVTPQLNPPDWGITKTKVVPTGTPSVDQPVTYAVTIKSNSVIGELNLHDVRIVDTIPSGSVFISASDGGTFLGGVVNWTIGNLNVGSSVTRYVTVKYPAKVVGVGFDTSSSVTNIADGFVQILGSQTDLTKQATVTHGFAIPTNGVGDFLKSGRQTDDRYSVGQTAKFYLSAIQNTGNIPLTNMVIEDTIPEGITLTSITTGTYNSAVTLNVYYKTNTNNTIWTPWVGGSFVSPSNATLNVSTLGLAENVYVTGVRWEITNGTSGIPAGFSETSPIGINGTVAMPSSGNLITNTAKLSANNDSIVKTSSKTISVINQMPWLSPSKTIKNGQTTYNMNDYVEYKLVIKNNDFATGDYHNPFAADMVPTQLEDVTFTGWNKGNSSITTDPVTDNTRTINGKKLLTWAFTGTLKPGEYVEVYYKAKIIDQTLAGLVTNDFYISSNTDTTFENPAGEQLADANDLNNNTIITDKFIKASNNIFVKFVGSIDAQKWVKGELDTSWNYYGQNPDSNYGKALPGGVADYRLKVKNDGANGPISDIVLIDILPTKGDKGVIDTSNRGSTWRPYLVNKITGENGVALDSRIKVYYSTNPNPSTADLYNPVGRSGAETDDWKLTPPNDITSVTALKFDFGSISLDPNKTMTLEWPMRAPLGAPTDEFAWNSFGYVASYPDVNGQQAFLPSEPKKVGFKVYPQPSSTYNLGDYVWDDLNKNGIQDDGNTGINGVLVNLYDAEGNLIRYTRTGNDQNTKPGYYLFPNLPNGHYSVEFVYPNSYKASLFNSGGDSTKDSDITGAITSTSDNGLPMNSIKTVDVVINNADNLNVDAGLYKVASLGDYVWNDEDKSGIQDSGEKFIDGVTVKLLDENGNQAKDDAGNLVADQVTGANGNATGKYLFSNLSPGVKYKVQFINPNGYYKFSDALKGADRSKDSDGVAAGDGLIATTTLLQLKSGENNIDVDQGMYLAQLGDFVWHDLNANGKQGDSGEAGINGVTVTLIDKATMLRAKDAYGVDVADAITGANSIGTGKYLFKNLKPGTYQVTFSKNGYAKFSPKDVTITGATDLNDSDVNRDTGTTDDIIIKPGDRNITVDAGLYNLVSIGDFVWNDMNGDGKQDTGEPGITDVKVTLLKGDGTPANDTDGNPVSQQTTLNDGKYKFTNLDPGSYIVKFENQDTEFVFSSKNVTGTGYTTSNDSNVNDTGVNIGKTNSISLTSNSGYNQTIDAGMHKASLGDYVWNDLNANGIQDTGENGYQGITVELLDGSGNAVKDSSNNPIKATTDINGKYEFNTLNSGDYIVKFNLPSGAFFSPKSSSGSTVANDSNADETTGKTSIITLNKGQRDLSWDAGIWKPASIGDFLWEDSNGNGVQDAGEPGLNGATVSLYQQGNPIPIKTTVTADNAGKAGYYLFDNLTPGNYSLKFAMPSGYDAFTFKNKGGTSLDSDVDNFGVTTFTDLTSDEKDMTWDAGVYKFVSLGDKVWRDTNMNGIQDSGEPGLVGVTANLYKYNGSSYVAKTFTTTDGSGNYLFDKLEPGQYKVEFVKPSGYSFTTADVGANNVIDSDASVDYGKTTDIILASGASDLTRDAGLYKMASVGDFVWNDANANGIQDAGEVGVSGVQVQLYDKNNNLINTTTTGILGAYSFTNVEPGDYYLKFVVPTHYTITDKNQGSDNTLNSNVDLSTLKTNVFTLAEGQNDPTWDMGIYKLSSTGDYVFEDMNANGIQDAGDKPLANVIVQLLDLNNNVIKTTTTDANGNYLFDDLKKGDYSVQFIGNGYVFSPQAAGINVNLDSNANSLGKTDKITLGVDQHLTDIDAGLYKLASLGDFVWLDKDNDGIQDANVKGISGITVNLLDANGIQIPGKTTTTDANGKYSFNNLTPVNYIVQFVSNKDYYKLTVQNAGADALDSDPDNVLGKTAVINLISGENNITIDAGYTVKADIKIAKTVYIGHDSGQGIGTEKARGVNGTAITYLFAVTNTGDTYLNDIAINDVTLGITRADMTIKSGRQPLAPGASIIYYYETTIKADLENTVSTEATPSDSTGITVPNVDKPSSHDIAFVDEINPKIDLQKTVYLGAYDSSKNGVETVSGKNGEVVTYIFTVKNTGDTILNNLQIIDQNLGIDATNQNKLIMISGTNPLQIGETAAYYYTTTINGSIINSATATGQEKDSGGNTITVEDTNTADITALGSIGDYLWYDNNGNGVEDPSEKPLLGVRVSLIDENRNELAYAITDSNGKYLFDRLLTGNYTVHVDYSNLPEGLIQTYEFDKSNDGRVNVSLAAGQNEDRIDFGYYKLGKLGNYVWEDANGNGIQDNGENPIENVTVNLYKADGTLSGTTTTDSNGLYKFDNLVLGDYYIEFVKPDGYKFTKLNSGLDNAVDSDVTNNGKTTSITVTAGTDDMTWDVGLYVPASIGDYLWYDNNGDGIQDPAEPALSGVTLNLIDKDGNIVKTIVTDSNGKYIFDGLMPGEYSVVVDTNTLPIGLKQTYESDSSNGGSVKVTVKSGDKVDTVDFGYYKLGKIGNYVWEDTNANGIQELGENPIPNVTVNLYKANGTLSDTTTTDSNGLYKFDNLVLGDYYIEFVKPDGYEFTKLNLGTDKTLDSDVASNGKTIPITVIAGTDDMTWDAGLYVPASIGDFVWLDKNNDGIQNVSEPGISGITVKLEDADGHVLETTTTGANGEYSFTNLVPGVYLVEFVSNKDFYKFTVANIGDDSLDSDVDKATGKTDTITLRSGDKNITLDSGFTVKTGIIVDKTVYAGHDGGKSTGSELVIGEKGTLVTYLFKVTNTGDTYLNNIEIKDTTLGTINKSNMIKISGEEPLAPGASLLYYYETSINGDLTNTANVAGTPSDNTGVIVPNIDNPTALDTANVDEVKPGIDVQKTIYFGKYNNGTNGVETASGKNGEWVTYIFTVTNIGDTYLNSLVISDVTLGIEKNGMTKISGTEPLAPGATTKYYYETKINGNLENTVTVTGNPSDSEGNALPNTKNPGDEDKANAKALGSIGDYLWYDNNGDGKQDQAEPSLSGVKLNLLDKEGIVVATTTTDSSGIYIFDRLMPAEYTVAVDTTTLPDGLKQTYELDGNYDGNVKVALTPGQIIDTVDFGYYRLGKLGNYVWEDTNGNGVQNVGENGIKGVTVNLYKADGTLSGTTTTDSNGLYKFNNLVLGDYYIEFVKPDGYEFTKLNTGVDNTKDSDVTNNGKTISITVAAGTNDMTWDAGMYKTWCISQSIVDKNNNPIPGAGVTLTDQDGKVIGKATTDSNGNFTICNVPPGTYTITISKDGYETIVEDDIPFGSAIIDAVKLNVITIPKTGAFIDFNVISATGILLIIMGFLLKLKKN